MGQYTIAAIPGAGIGSEPVPGVTELVDRVAPRRDVRTDWLRLDWSSSRYHEVGEFITGDWRQTLGQTDAVFLGAVGDPTVPDHISLWGLLLAIRRGLRQSVNARPVVSLAGVAGPLRDEQPFALVIVGENNEGEYTNVGGSLCENSDDELVVQSSVFTWRATERVIRVAFEQVRRLRRDLVSVTKSNGLVFCLPFWDNVVREVARGFPDVRFREMHVDALVARLVLVPSEFDVIVASNLFGDIPSDLGAASLGGAVRRVRECEPSRRRTVDVRAGVRVGAGHYRSGDRQPDWPGSLSLRDARASRLDPDCPMIWKGLCASGLAPERPNARGGGNRDHSRRAGVDRARARLWRDRAHYPTRRMI